MNFEIRRAKIAQADDLTAIINTIFEDKIDPERLRLIFCDSHNFTYIAESEGKIVGFVDNFLTVSHDTKLRLELDLLGIHPDYRGQGIGRKLIKTSIDLSKNLRVSLIRALVASSNTVMQHTCQSLDFSKQPHDILLYVKQPANSTGTVPQSSSGHLISVQTLTYSGVWIEGEVSPEAIERANTLACHIGGITVGTLIDVSDVRQRALLKDFGFEEIAQYNWWSMDLESDQS